MGQFICNIFFSFSIEIEKSRKFRRRFVGTCLGHCRCQDVCQTCDHRKHKVNSDKQVQQCARDQQRCGVREAVPYRRTFSSRSGAAASAESASKRLNVSRIYCISSFPNVV